MALIPRSLPYKKGNAPLSLPINPPPSRFRALSGEYFLNISELDRGKPTNHTIY